MSIQKLFTSRVANTNGSTFVGERGHIFYDEANGLLKLSDGHTAGGLPIINQSLITSLFPALSGDVSNIQGNTTVNLTPVNNNPGTYGSAVAIPVITVDTKGRITSVTTTASSGTINVVANVILIGDISGNGVTGSNITTTLSTVNSNVGSFGTSSTVSTFVVNGKGLITSASNIAFVGNTSIITVGNLVTGTWSANTLAILYGGTGQTTKLASFDALSPLATLGDLLFYNGTHNANISIGTTNQILSTIGGIPTWTTSANLAVNLVGGAVNSLPYQSNVGVTSFVPIGTGVLQFLSGSFSWTQSPQVTTQGLYDSTNTAATTAFVHHLLDFSMSTVPILVLTGGIYSFNSLGAGAVISITAVAGVITGVTAIPTAGTGFKIGDVVTLAGGGYDAHLRVTAVAGTGITGIEILYGGTGYSTGASLSTLTAQTLPFKYTLAGTLTSNATFLMTNGSYYSGSNQWVFANNTTGPFTVAVYVSNTLNTGASGPGVLLPQGTGNSTNTFIETDGSTGVWIASSVMNGMVTNLAVVTTTYAITNTDYTILANASIAPFTISLPAAPVNGQIFNIKKIDTSANIVSVSGNGRTIDGSAFANIKTQWNSIQLQYSTAITSWNII